MGVNRSKRVVYAGCTEAGFDLMRYIHEELIDVDELLTLTPEQGEKYGVSGYFDCSDYCERNNIDMYTPKQYSMTDTDIEHYKKNPTDIMIVHGWQRLIPSSVLNTITHGALGLHGSAFGLPAGRGRSPMNWSLIEGLDRFLLSVLHLDEGADSGGLVATKKFDISDRDTIRTMYYKLVVAGQKLFDNILSGEIENGFNVEAQDGKPTFYPKRYPKDGAINWEDPTNIIDRLVRAVGEPYPGAFTEYESERVFFWEAQPFSTDFIFDEPPGTIVQIFTPDRDFVVQTCDGTLLVTDWEADDWEPKVGMTFESLDNESIGSPNRVDRYDKKDTLSDS
jgi:UDP-4-amino-4-deoxy-L-arabinose formyltransferase/UDP-glucuronic acid dehydrogenase (UDP-4-keto-hexauronic acid decarboxylating)